MSTQSTRNAKELLEARYAEGKLICLGLDPTYEKLPPSVLCRYDDPNVTDLQKAIAYLDFCIRIVDATYDLVAAFKPNTAFFEAAGYEGYMMLEVLIQHIHRVAPDVVIVLDAKRGDIGKTNIGSVKYMFDRLDVDAVTVNPYFGGEALSPFLERPDKMVIVLVRTSNPGGAEFQNVMVSPSTSELEAIGLDPNWGEIPLYQYVAMGIRSWQTQATTAVVVGATVPEPLHETRLILPETTILIPGVGTQGGKLELAIQNGLTAARNGALVNAGSEGLYASQGADFAQQTRLYVVGMDQQARQFALAV